MYIIIIVYCSSLLCIILTSAFILCNNIWNSDRMHMSWWQMPCEYVLMANALQLSWMVICRPEQKCCGRKAGNVGVRQPGTDGGRQVLWKADRYWWRQAGTVGGRQVLWEAGRYCGRQADNVGVRQTGTVGEHCGRQADRYCRWEADRYCGRQADRYCRWEADMYCGQQAGTMGGRQVPWEAN